MKNGLNKTVVGLLTAGVVLSSSLFAGNEDRIGSAGASHLLINPWARGSAIGDAGVANMNGLEATFTNVAGLAFTDKTQIKFNYSNWMGNAGISLNSAGFAQRISESSVFSVSVQSLNYGDIPITTVANPEGNIGFFSPRANIFNVAYAKEFSSSISGGINFKVISENISNMKATGIALDAGIRYVTGEQDQIKFGIALKNVGPVMKYRGDGLAQQVSYVSTGFIGSLENRSATYEMPSLLSIGGSYDFIFTEANKLNVAFAFTANSFSKDQFRLGLDYAMTTDKMAFNVRGGYIYEKGIFSAENRSNALLGPTAGFSIDALVGKSKSALGLEYCARFAGVFGIIHTIGATISLK
ncbi:MAG: PorV/PorQ family protein [Crocinitomicaceae bacterium]|nr:PorV/PorQ family protein [Crocinitomicaceae bacterium]MCF8410014.1 PorV/PorQ family protein [Crocinitomicaceae bacterium]